MMSVVRFIGRRVFVLWVCWCVLAFTLAVALESDSEGALMNATFLAMALLLLCALLGRSSKGGASNR